MPMRTIINITFPYTILSTTSLRLAPNHALHVASILPAIFHNLHLDLFGSTTSFFCLSTKIEHRQLEAPASSLSSVTFQSHTTANALSINPHITRVQRLYPKPHGVGNATSRNMHADTTSITDHTSTNRFCTFYQI